MKSNTASYAQRELDILVKSSTDPENRPIIEPFIPEILALTEKFGLSGQSGGSAPYTASAISQAVKKLLLQRPIMPMTGIDEEWIDVGVYADKGETECLWQNTRCYNLFKNSKGQAWYLDAISWKDQDGLCTSGSAFLRDGSVLIPLYSRQLVKSFPFTPKTFYIDVIREENGPYDFGIYIKDKRQLDRVFKYYDKYDFQ